MDSRIGIVLCAHYEGIEGGSLTKHKGGDRGFLCELGALRRSRARDREYWMGLTGLKKKRFSLKAAERQREERLGEVWK